jgi:hypothetical protein
MNKVVTIMEASRKINISEIGEVFYRLYDSEINFRFENRWDDAYRWAVVGYKENPDESRLLRVEIDDAIQSTPDRFCIDRSFQSKLDLPHFVERDWFERGYNYGLELAIIGLCEAVCKLYPQSDFRKWYMSKKLGKQLPTFLYTIRSAERLICKLPADDNDRNVWLMRNGISEEAVRLRMEPEN